MSPEQRFQDTPEYELLEPYMDEQGLVAGYRIQRLQHRDPWRHTAYEATSPQRRPVTFKLLHPRLGENRRVARRLQHDIRQRASVRHPHLVRIFDWGEVGDHHYMVTGLRREPTLAEVMSVGRLEPRACVRLLSQLADALETAHEAGLVHRELAPQNVLVGPRGGGHILLGDFGVANPDWGSGLLDLSEPAAYVSPEKLRDEPLTPESNVYSLACILVECLTGSPPYDSELPGAVAYAHVAEDPPILSERCPELPRSLDAVVAAAMAKDPKERLGSPRRLIAAAAAALDLERALTYASGPGRPSDPSEGRQPFNGEARSAGAGAGVGRVPHAKIERPLSRLKSLRHHQLAGVLPRPADLVNRIGELRRRAAGALPPPADDVMSRPRHLRQRLAYELPLRGRAVAVILVLVVAALGILGFVVGRSGDDERPVAASEAATPAQVRAERRRAAVVRRVDRALDTLDTRRAVARRRLATARNLRDQSSAARELASANRAAQRALPGESRATAGLASALSEAARAYDRLAIAARRGSRRRYPAASRAVRRSEGNLLEAIARINDSRR